MNDNHVYKFLIFIFLILIFHLAGCTSVKDTRYEQKPKEEKKEIKNTTLPKTMEVREREFVRKLKISGIDRINFEYDSKGGLVNKGKVSTAKYDQKGFLTETVIFDQKGKVQNRFEYKYNTNGFRIESVRYDAQNKLDKKYSYEYNNIGNKIKSTRFDSKGNAEKYYLYDFDSNLNLISEEWFDMNGNMEYKIEAEYDDEGNKTVSYSYDENGKLNYKYFIKYDDKQNIIEEQKYDGKDKPVGIIQYLYKHYP
jgi:hypothetical protein